ncbi:hypothetical protein [Blastococcus brunescens]|uniref:DUF4386 family protein n=1 Tax=Blastococcus brunescens TaxID=1564165 RepID=A0ABZ1B2N5_9ACTN|nr:hypothetical protein [Blastococcus sp. BMG 8361]WRL65060.1 hypothetical protein U6N30_05005 [Blastococcus sp. BMG 8361]
MTTTTAHQSADTRTRRRGSPLHALAGLGALTAFAAAAVVFGDPIGGADTAQEAARALHGSSAELAAVLLGAYALLAMAVTGGLAARLGRERDSGAIRIMPVMAAAHVLLLATAFVAFAGAVVVGRQVLGGGVSPGAAESALLITNVAHPMSAWLGAGFLVAVALAARSTSRVLAIVSAVFAVGLLLPPVGWAVTYLMAFWFAGVGSWLWRQG